MSQSADIEAFTEAQTQGFRLMNHILKGLDSGLRSPTARAHRAGGKKLWLHGLEKCSAGHPF